MNELMIFENPNFGSIRSVEIDGEAWLVGKDVAQALGYSNTKDAISAHVDEEDRRILQRSEIATIENHIPKSMLPFDFVPTDVPNRGLTIINESGLYSLVLSSKLPGAKQFRRWVTSEVLPTIRKHGAYVKPTAHNSEADAVNRRANAMLLNAKNRTAAILQRIYDQAGVKPEYQVMAFSDFYAVDGVHLPRDAFRDVKQTYDKGTIAEKLGIYSKASGGKKPHAQAVGAIISTLDILDEEREALPYCNNGHDGVDYQYTESVVEKVRNWMEEHGWPAPVSVGGKSYGVVYQEAQ